MAPVKRVNEAIATFYELNRPKGKYFTYSNFKNELPKTTIYRIMKFVDERGSISRKEGSGRPPALDQKQRLKLSRMVNHKTGVSQRKLGEKLNVGKSTVNRHIKSLGIQVRRRKRAPKQTPEQKQRQHDRLLKLIDSSFSEDSDKDIVMDDESYFTLDGTGMPGNDIFYTNNIAKTPNEIKFRRQAKFPAKIMVWAVISRHGIKLKVFSKNFTSMNNEIYREKCLTEVLKFIDKHYASRDDAIFWPDLATCHYHKKNLEWMNENGLHFVPKEENPPNAPQIRPIEKYWALLKQKTYEGNWSAKTPDQLAARIKKCAKLLPQETIIKMFDNLKEKVHKASRDGLESLL